MYHRQPWVESLLGSRFELLGAHLISGSFPLSKGLSTLLVPTLDRSLQGYKHNLCQLILKRFCNMFCRTAHFFPFLFLQQRF